MTAASLQKITINGEKLMLNTKRLLTAACMAVSLAVGAPALLGHSARAEDSDDRRAIQRSQDRVDDHRDAIQDRQTQQRRDLREGNVAGTVRKQAEIHDRREAIDNERDRQDDHRDRIDHRDDR